MSGNWSAAVVVVTYNSRRHLDAFFAHLMEGMSGVDGWRLIVVDNASQDGTPQAVHALWPSATVLTMDRNAGYAAAINAGSGEADAEGPILVLNPDVQLHRGCARVLFDELSSESADIAVPRLLDADGTTSPSLRRDPSLQTAWAEAILGGRRAARLGRSELIVDPRAYQYGHEVEWATGAVMAISSECRKVVGPWDESFFLYSEEVDYCRRARSYGFRIRYVPEAVAGHTGGEYQTNAALWELLVRNRYRDYRRHHGATKSLAFRAAVATGELLRSPRAEAHRSGFRAMLRPISS